jgi:hypothetical protein
MGSADTVVLPSAEAGQMRGRVPRQKQRRERWRGKERLSVGVWTRPLRRVRECPRAKRQRESQDAAANATRSVE